MTDLDELRREYRLLTSLELQDEIAVHLFSAADAENEFALALVRRRMAVAQRELHRRTDLQLLSTRYDTNDLDLDPQSSNLIPWLDLAASIRDHHDGIALILEPVVPGLKRAGHNWRGGDEYAGPCLVCGGSDRFVVWVGPPGRYWCRGCGLRGDIISAYRMANPTAPFRSTITILASQLGLSLPPIDPKRRVQSVPDLPLPEPIDLDGPILP